MENEQIDMDTAISGADLGLASGDEPPNEPQDDLQLADEPQEAVEPQVVAAPSTPAVREPPKSWAKDKHEIWAKLPPEAQDYYAQREEQMLTGLEQYKTDAGFGKQLKEVVAPFQQMIQSHGLDVPKAVASLLGAHQRLTTGTPEARLAAYQQLGKDLGLSQGEQQQVDPALKAVQDEMAQIKQSLTAREQQELTARQQAVSKEIEAFAADKANPYFDEVADDMVPFLNAGASLKDAYDKAIWANPVTRAKEQARLQTEADKKLRENARLDALKGRKASSTNVRSRDTNRAPTDPLGSMDDTLKETFNAIQSRTH